MASSYEITLDNFPDWAIPMTRVVPIFYTTDEFDIAELNVSYDFQYWWEKIGTDKYRLLFYADVLALNEDLEVQLVYMDLNLYISNERLIKNPNKNKV